MQQLDVKVWFAGEWLLLLIPGDGKTIHDMVFDLLGDLKDKGNCLFMDNYYNSVGLSKKKKNCWLSTHACGTLRHICGALKELTRGGCFPLRW
ncbi:hypothetical protein PR048_003653 [Dryococelus australis]|uniref:PiggyBac transposable element-derived protein domain-containing protein n=1 Tax=Dryococelus australis TaxID=614101 RepID=A0ABQ9INM3_9NEOP|nr:hypothetical protein PR048_003653 [Dryococelus australis]